ncbi:MAG: DUF1801 domain-containing protein [Erysipelotrichales bacterium]|nr:DUF1801 domain-containing protein [Erysipelotrichales bacterium]
MEIFDEVNLYFNQQEAINKEKLRMIRRIIRNKINDSEDKVIRLPAIQVVIKGKGVLYYGAYKNHISIWSFEKLGDDYVLVEYIKDKFPQYKYTKATIQIANEQVITEAFLNEICEFITN